MRGEVSTVIAILVIIILVIVLLRMLGVPIL